MRRLVLSELLSANALLSVGYTGPRTTDLPGGSAAGSGWAGVHARKGLYLPSSNAAVVAPRVSSGWAPA
eukprot:1640833-Alexandrium_andersonii.AAC.1